MLFTLQRGSMLKLLHEISPWPLAEPVPSPAFHAVRDVVTVVGSGDSAALWARPKGSRAIGAGRHDGRSNHGPYKLRRIESIQVEVMFDLTPCTCFIIQKLLLGTAPD